jgi:hypothetical protein
LGELRLSYRDYVFAFEFAALDYSAPPKNRYAYKMEGLDRDWIYTSAAKRYANYTTLPPGRYIFRVKGSNSDGVWNENAISLKVAISPPFWNTWWFRALLFAAVATFVVGWYRRNLRDALMKAELQAAHDAQMSIMPQSDPTVEGFEISGTCIPASEVGGDFFDFFWLREDRTRLGIAVGDVSGKAMKAAMIAVMSNGMISSKADDTFSPGETMTQLNRPMHSKTDEHVFTALWLAALETKSKTITFSNAGFLSPLLKSDHTVRTVEGEGPRFPLGAMKNIRYEEQSLRLASGDVLIVFTDGIPEARNHAQQFYEYNNLKRLVDGLNTSHLSAREIKQAIMADAQRFMGGASPEDDMTLVVIKSK